VAQSGPQCKVEPKLLTPFGQFKLPLDSTMSISPDDGQFPYSAFFGNIQIAGQIQSPLGILALTTTLPYLAEKLFTVRNLALLIGLR
jgi:hypothetical protein